MMGRVLGLDWGEVRVGVAISDELWEFAHPLETIDLRKVNGVERVVGIVKGYGVVGVVIGMPRNMDGSYGEAAERVRRFAEKLQGRLEGVALYFVDERWSTRGAERVLREVGKSSRQQRGILDRVAAQEILQTWLDANRKRME
ncbi:MAG: Holliday junction resolvase RuvX [Chthoniobacterales bacterium]|nr:Holliday junction resolvase RuvX [Chthoniobacterales bacterium]